MKPVQLSVFDTVYQLSPRQKKLIEKGWAGSFNTVIIPVLVELEDIFEPLYSSKRNTRPSTPTYLVLGMLLLKSLFRLTDDELLHHVNLSLEYQYALGTTSFEEQHVNQRTLNRFRTANAVYFNETGKDLMAEFTEKLAAALKKAFLDDNLKRRMDSIMVDNGSRHLSRLQLAHVVTKGALFLLRDHEVSVTDELQHYVENFDENAVTYHTTAPASEKLETAFRDTCAVRNLIPEGLRESEEARILECVFSEQFILTEDGSFDTVRDGKTLTSTTLNNPAEPESTIRKKAGKTHHGFVGNFAESVDMDTNRKIIDSVDFQPNTYSDSQFARDEIARMAKAGDTPALVPDGAYASVDNINEADGHGIELTAIAMTGKETADLMAVF